MANACTFASITSSAGSWPQAHSEYGFHLSRMTRDFEEMCPSVKRSGYTWRCDSLGACGLVALVSSDVQTVKIGRVSHFETSSPEFLFKVSDVKFPGWRSMQLWTELHVVSWCGLAFLTVPGVTCVPPARLVFHILSRDVYLAAVTNTFSRNATITFKSDG